MKKNKKIKQRKSSPISYKELSYKYRLLSYLMDNAPDVIYFKDRNGRLVLVNQSHAKGLGARPEDIVGKTDFDFFPKKRAEIMAEDDMYVIKSGKPIIDKVERATRPDGIDNYVSTTKIPMRDERGKVIGLIGITRDITRRMQFDRLKKEKIRTEKKLEILETLNSLKSEFISTVSHELRTPLAIIKQLVMLVLNETTGSINKKQKEILKKTDNNIERLRNLIDELLDISRIERDKLKLHYSLVNLNDLLKDSSNFFKKLAQEKGITLSYHLPGKAINLFIDADRINQVISNLINNAIKFSEEGGGIKVEVKVLETKVRIAVVDAGIGIARTDLPQIFNKFMQVSKTFETERKGIGLGLSIAKELIERHGGEIWVESKVGVGSKFYFTVPLFYRPNKLNKQVKNKIDSLLNRGISVQFINLLIVDYKEFRKRVSIEPKRLFNDIRIIIDGVIKKACQADVRNSSIILTDIRNGRCSIILPGMTQKKATELANLFRDEMKRYFIKNKTRNAFITLGVMSYPRKMHLRKARHFPVSFSIKEIYIGSETRRFERTLYKVNIKILVPKNKTESSQTVDISKGGICFVSSRLLRTDSRIQFRLDFPKNKGSIYTEARIAWIKKMESSPGKTVNKYKVGTEFINLKNKYRKILAREVKF